MKKIILTCGLIGGLISVAWCIFSEQVFSFSMSMDARLYLGYATMLIGFSLIFVAIKNYRDNYNNGVITFGKALKIGLLITLVASTVYVVIWMIDFKFFIPDFFDKYKSLMLADLKAKGASAAAIQKQLADMDGYQQMYKNPIFVALLTYSEIVPVGIVVSLIAALILKRKSNPTTVNV